MSDILVVGSVAYDTISTPAGRADLTLGGSANYFSIAASLYSKVNVVGVVGEDYRQEDFAVLRERNVCLEGLQQVPGKTFKWEGKYEGDMNDAITLDTQLNVFEHFNPTLPEKYKNSEYVFLANIDPILQMSVFEQVPNAKVVGLDTMNYWIDSKLDDLRKVLSKVDLLLINEEEARKLAGTPNTICAVENLHAMGPRAIIVKRGEYGFVLYVDKQLFILPAYPVPMVVDPTGAGDTFAGGVFGYLAKVGGEWDINHIKQACVHGCIMASFTVQDFGLGAIKNLDWSALEKRHLEYRRVVSLDLKGPVLG